MSELATPLLHQPSDSSVATDSSASPPPQPARPASTASQRTRRKYRRPLLRRTGAPSQRDFSIFKKVELERLTHDEVAGKFGLHRSRVTQICHNVRRYLAQATADDPNIENHLARQRLDAELEKLRYEFALEAAADAIRRERPTLVTNRAGARRKNDQEEGWNETVNRDVTPSMQPLKIFVRVTRELGKLNQRSIQANPVGQNLTQCQMFQAISDLLHEWSIHAADRKDAPSHAFIEMVSQFQMNIRQWIYHYRYGCGAAAAWPRPAVQAQDDGDQQGANASDVSTNHEPQEVNRELTAMDGVFEDASHEGLEGSVDRAGTNAAKSPPA
jgi:hypothetical protein